MSKLDINKWTTRVRAASRAQVRPWVRALRRELAICADDFEAGVFSEEAHTERLIRLYTEAYRATGQRFHRLGGQMLRDQGAEIREQRFTFLERVERLVRHQAPQRARRVARRTGQIINRVLIDAAKEGIGERETAKRIRDAISGRLSVARARTIARTEIGAAQNAGLIQSAEDAQVRYVKRWVTIEDGRARLSHMAVDGKTIGQGEKFRVGDAELEHPGDPSGPPEEIINCRCTMLLELAA